MTISPEQCRGARAMLGFEQGRLAELAKVSRNTIASFESGQRVPGANNLAAIRAALEAAGVIFVDENGEGPGVRLSAAKKCALELVLLAERESEIDAVQGAKRAVANYAERERRGLRLAFDEVMLLYRDDRRSDTRAGNAIFKWLENEIIGC